MAAWDRLPGETDKAFQAFVIFRDMKLEDRSIMRAVKAFNASLGITNLEKGDRRWFDYSRKYSWVARVNEFDAMIDRIRQDAAEKQAVSEGERIAKDRRDHKRSESKIARQMMAKAIAILRMNLLKRKTVTKVEGDHKTITNIYRPVRASMNSAALLARVASDIGRRGLEIHDDESDVAPEDFKSMFFVKDEEIAAAVPDGALPARPADPAVKPVLSLPSPEVTGSGNGDYVKPPRERPGYGDGT